MTERTSIEGVLAVDKPQGPTSHDVVREARRVFGTRAVGHAGTLDPMATGVLVLLFGEATKLCPYLTAQEKTYVADVTLGTTTDTLDADGRVVETGQVPSLTHEDVAAALDAERARTSQVPPVFSAIKQGGRSVHRLARRGEHVQMDPREVSVSRIALSSYDANVVRVEMTVSKGYFVRSFARDLGQRLGAPAHLSALRRTASGRFTIADSVRWPCPAATPLTRVVEAARLALPTATLTPDGLVRAKHGKVLQPEHFERAAAELAAWLSPRGDLVAVGTRAADGYRVARGFNAC